MDIKEVFNLISDISLVLLAISPTVFVFGVTLLGTAIEKARQEEKAARENEATNIKNEIAKIEKSIEKLKKNGDTTDLLSKLNELKESQVITNKKIEDIRVKYNSINLANTVLYPCSALVVAIIMNPLGSLFYDLYKLSAYPIMLSQMLLVFYGVIRIYRSLHLIQEINADKKESENYDRMREAFKLALAEYYQSKKEEVSIKFTKKSFPLNVTPSTKLSIEFRVNLKKGSVLNNVSVWFFIPDGFELINPQESASWKQASDYDLPNIRTVKVKIGTLSIGAYRSGTLIVKTPTNSEKYTLRYKVYAGGYKGSNQDIVLFVG